MGLERLWVKDESQLPTGSFKSRGMTTAVSMARHLRRATRLAIPTAGNAGGAWPLTVPAPAWKSLSSCRKTRQSSTSSKPTWPGRKSFLVNGLITDCGRIVREGAGSMGWFDMSTLKEPYRLEGKKTMGLELAEQLGWSCRM